jgi:hypothetical protein
MNLKGELFSTVGIGIVVLITGYLLMDSVRSRIKKSMEGTKQYVDRILEERTKKWEEHYTGLFNLQKATYMASKKNTILLSDQMNEVIAKLEMLESDHTKELQRITMLLKKTLEGQKNTFQMDVQYGRQNTKLLLDAIKEDGNKSDLIGQLSRIHELLEENNQLLKDYNLNKHNYDTQDVKSFEEQGINETPSRADSKLSEELTIVPEEISQDSIYENNLSIDKSEVKSDDKKNELMEETSEKYNTSEPQHNEEPEVLENENTSEASDQVKVVPLYDDPNKNLSTDEIAALFASVIK